MPPTDDRPRLDVFWDDAFLDYRWPDGAFFLESSALVAFDEPHPERPERVQNIRAIVEACLADHASWHPVEPATDDQLAAVHDPDYLAALERIAAGDGEYVNYETWLDGPTFEAARLAAGAAIAAADLAVADPSSVPYALVRPSGHHAQPACADGYCFLNNAAVAAEDAIRTTPVERVAVVDWDVHHANGTQEVFYDRDDVLVVGVHNDHGSWDPETHPQTGRPDEHGIDAGEGYTVNVPVPAGTGDRGYERVFERVVEPVVGAFDPDLVVASAGQDAGVVDPLGRNLVTKAGFQAIGGRVASLAREHAGGRLAVIQEGGYQVSHLPYATLGVLEGVLGVDTGVEDPFGGWDEGRGCLDRALDAVADHYSTYWPGLASS